MSGYNFRETIGFVTDGVDDEFVPLSQAYPRNTGGIDFGWSANPVNSSDRDAAVDPKLAGGARGDNTGLQSIFAFNTGNGSFDVTLALGDAVFASTAYCDIVDLDTSNAVQSVLAVVANNVTVSGGEWVDASGVLRASAAAWVSDNLVSNVTVTSGRLGIRIADSSANAQRTLLSHIGIEAVAAGPVITDVNTTNVVQVGDTPIVTGTSFLATGGTQAWGGVSVGFSSWSDTSITSSAITRGDLAYDTNYDWIVTDNLAAASTAVSVQLAIETGFQFVTLSSPIITLVGGYRTSLCYGSVPDCVTGDQLRVPLLTDQGKAIDISAADGTFVITGAGDTEQTFDFEIWDANAATGDKWSASAAVVVNGNIVGAVPAASRTSVFHIAAALRALETYTHTQTNEIVVEWLESEGISRTTLNGMLYGYLGGLGYTGSIDDRMKQWREAG